MQLPAADLDRFHSAQSAGSPSAHDRALAELRAGRQRSHWVWFVLPQLAGVGRSAIAQRYGIAHLAEASAYLADPLLRQRLEAVIAVIDEQLRKPGQSLEHLMVGPPGWRAPVPCWIGSGGVAGRRWSGSDWRCLPDLQQSEAMATSAAPPIDQRLAGMAAQIRQLIPSAEVRLFGSRARGQARPDSDIDLLITAPDAWLAQRDRFSLLSELWGAVAQPDLSVDMVLHSCSEANRRAQEPGSLVQEAFSHGVLLNGQP